MKYNKYSRRMFLQGSGGFFLSIPTLVSLLPKAHASSYKVKPRFLFMSCQNGGQQSEQWFPKINSQHQPQTMAGNLFKSGGSRNHLPRHDYYSDKITFNSRSGISPIFDSRFNSLVPKMNFVRGLDQRFSPFGNHRGAPLLGNVASAHGSMWNCPVIPTIDQIMAHSKGFYPEGHGHIPSLVIDTKRYLRPSSYYWSNTQQRTGDIISIPSVADPKAIFESLFGTTSVVSGSASETPRVDAVLDDYKRTLSSRGLGRDDRLALNEIMDHLAEFEKKISGRQDSNIDSSLSCAAGNAPESIVTSNANNHAKQCQLMVDIITLAFKCERTRVVTWHFIEANGIGDGRAVSSGTWHWASHNSHNNKLAYDTLGKIYKWIADHALHPLVSKLNSTADSDGKKILDNSLVHFATSSAHTGHNELDLPTLLFGSAGGFFNTGNFVDYRNRLGNSNRGLLHNQYLVNVMYSMGLKSRDWDMNALGLNGEGKVPLDTLAYGWFKHFSGMSDYGRSIAWEMAEKSVADPLPGLVSPSRHSVFGT